MKRNFNLLIIGFSVFLIIFMVGVTYFNLPKCDDSQIILSSVGIRNFGVGFTTQTDHLRFGELAAGSHVYRYVTINSTKNYNVEVMTYGPMSKWLIPEFEEFFISSGEEKKVRFDIFVPFDVFLNVFLVLFVIVKFLDVSMLLYLSLLDLLIL